MTSVSLTPAKQVWQDLTGIYYAVKSSVETAAKRSGWLNRHYSHYYYFKGKLARITVLNPSVLHIIDCYHYIHMYIAVRLSYIKQYI